MSTILLDFKDYIVTDNGQIVVKCHRLLKQARIPIFPDDPDAGLWKTGWRWGKNVDLPVIVDGCDNIAKFNIRNPDHAIRLWQSDGSKERPNQDTYAFDIPQGFLEFDLNEFLNESFILRFPHQPENYRERITLEMAMMRERGMDGFLRSLIYVVSVFQQNEVVYGIGRGSCCASLVLYLIGVHFVDPIEYDISISEFLR